MSTVRNTAPMRMIVGGRPLLIDVLPAPTIDDVLETEARIYAVSLAHNEPALNDRRVGRDVRDFLIRNGVEHK